MKSYGQVIDSIEALPDEQQESLLELFQKRLVERRRAALIQSVQEARNEFKSGKLRPANPAEFMGCSCHPLLSFVLPAASPASIHNSLPNFS